MTTEQTTTPEATAPIPTEHKARLDHYVRRGFPIATADRLARDDIAAQETADANAEAAKIQSTAAAERSLESIPANADAVVPDVPPPSTKKRK